MIEVADVLLCKQLKQKGHILKAPGTPMIKPSAEESSWARFTLFPGEPSVSSRWGIESPTLTKAGRVEWKLLAAVKDERAARFNGRRADRNAMLTGREGVLMSNLWML